MTRILPAVLMIALGLPVAAAAQPGATPVPACPECARAAADASPIRRQVQQRHTDVRQLQLEQRANNANLINLIQLRLDAARGGDAAAVRDYEQSIADLQADNKANSEQQFKSQQEIQSLNEQLEKIGRDVDACNKRCSALSPNLPTGTPVTPPSVEIAPGPLPPPPEGVAAPPLRTPPACDDCKGSVDELQREHRELQRRAERANAAKDAVTLRDFEAQRRRVRNLQRQVDECGKQCKPKETTSSRWSSPVIGAVGGAAVLGALLARGGDDPTLVTPPIGNQPQPPTQPPTQPTVAGIYDAVDCIVLEDSGNQNGSIRMCESAGGPWEVQVASITIRHAPPFVNIEGAAFDAASGEFAGATRGTVAGVPNVAIGFEGVANAQSGRIAFVYEMGNGGELPGGQPIAYGITLQKRN